VSWNNLLESSETLIRFLSAFFYINVRPVLFSPFLVSLPIAIMISVTLPSRPFIKEKTSASPAIKTPERQTTSWFGIEDRLVSFA
jgi:hypothetical protein